MTHIFVHPFKEGILGILNQYFSPSIVKNFKLDFEVDLYNNLNPNIQRQKKDNNYKLEVSYKTGPDTAEYICDVFSWESKTQTELRLLQFITDKYKAKTIGKDWAEKDGRIMVGKEVLSGKHATKDE
jgi:hypothetical protein